MLIVLSPSKTLDFSSKIPALPHTQPEWLGESAALIKALRGYSEAELGELMGISAKLAALNAERYRTFKTPFTARNARPALLAFKGDVYDGIAVESYREKDFAFAQAHMRILSGLYGVLRPLDLIQPYRLEMGIALPTKRGKNLYRFWENRVTDTLNAALAKHKNKLLVNLASEEYFKAVKPDALDARLLNVVFKEKQKGTLKVVGLFAKKARGLMADFIVKNRIDDDKGLKAFVENGYRFEKGLSDEYHYVFVR